MNISEIRDSYPQYGDLSDDELARGMHSKFYSDIPYDEFTNQIGLTAANEPVINQPIDDSRQYRGDPQGLDALSQEQVEDLPSLEGAINQAGQGASFGLLDELQAAILATVGVNIPESMGGLPDNVKLSEAYTGIRDEIRGKNEEFAEENPKLSAGLQLGGAIATGGIGAAKAAAALPKAVTAGQKMVKGAQIAAVEGGVAGLGLSEAETVGGVIKDTAMGAAIAAPFGFAAGGVNAYLSSKAAKSEALIQAINANPNGKAVKAMIKGGAKHESLPVMKEASKQGFDDGVIGTVIGASDVDRAAMRKMVNIYVKNQNNPKLALRNRPADVIGESVAKRYKYIKSKNREAGKQIDAISKGLKGKEVNHMPVIDEFLDGLGDAGVTLDKKGLSFQGSDFDPFPASQTLINKVFKQASTIRDAHDVHRMKRTIDKLVAYGKSNQKNADIDAEMLVKGFRKNLDDLLDNKFPKYNNANVDYSKTIDALNDVDALIGKNSNISSENFDKTLGTLSRRISSNAISGGRVDDALSKMDDVALEMGGKFGDDFESLVIFSNELERRLPTQIRTSLKGQIGDLTEQVRPKNILGEKLSEAYNKKWGVTDESALIALRRLVNQKF